MERERKKRGRKRGGRRGKTRDIRGGGRCGGEGEVRGEGEGEGKVRGEGEGGEVRGEQYHLVCNMIPLNCTGNRRRGLFVPIFEI